MSEVNYSSEVDFEFETPFSAPDLNAKELKILALADGRRYLVDREEGSTTLFVARVKHDGTPDRTFGPNGWRADSLGMSTTNCVLAGVLPREGGGVLVALSNDLQFGLICFNADGTLDSTFGHQGKTVHVIISGVDSDNDTDGGQGSGFADETPGPWGASEGLAGLVPGVDGSFYGMVRNRAGLFTSVVSCRADGRLNVEFNGKGSVFISHPVHDIRIYRIAPTSDGGVVAVGELDGGTQAVFCRYNRDGSLDAQFGEGGFAAFNFESVGVPAPDVLWMALRPIAVLANRGFVACGRLVLNSTSLVYGLVICIDFRGMPIASFNQGKPLVFELPDSQQSDFRYGGVAELPDGKLVVSGDAIYTFSEVLHKDILVARFLEDGRLDTDFAGRGWMTLKPYKSRRSYLSDMVVDSNGKILLAGSGGLTERPLSLRRDVLIQFK